MGQTCHRRQGFTLIELLVVVAVLSILAALVMPAVQDALLAGAAASCKSNLRQVGFALQSYRQTYLLMFPRWGQARWHGDEAHGGAGANAFRMMPSVLLREYIDPKHEVWVCPGDVPAKTRGTAWWVCSYQFNGNLNSVPDQKVRVPSRVIAVQDCWDDWGWYEFPLNDPGGSDAPYLLPNHEAYNRHSHGMNCLYYDGHVDRRRPGETTEDDFKAD